MLPPMPELEKAVVGLAVGLAVLVREVVRVAAVVVVVVVVVVAAAAVAAADAPVVVVTAEDASHPVKTYESNREPVSV